MSVKIYTMYFVHLKIIHIFQLKILTIVTVRTVVVPAVPHQAKFTSLWRELNSIVANS
jgi:hypothetical protein